MLLTTSMLTSPCRSAALPASQVASNIQGIVTRHIREAKEGRGDLAVLWLVLSNAYVSVPPKLIEEAPKRYHIPLSISNLIVRYYNFYSMSTSEAVISDWHHLERGIIIGCTVSFILSTIAFNFLIKSAESRYRGPLMRSGVRQPHIRAYIDDLTVTTSSVTCRRLLKGLEITDGYE